MSYVDDLLEEDDFIDGLEEVGELEEVGDYEEIGRRVAAKMRGRRKARRLQSPRFARSAREVLRRAPLGFPQFSLAAAIGDTDTQTARTQRKLHPDRLLIIPSAAGIVVDSIKVGDEEQLLASGVPVELYGVNALTDTLPDNFSPVPSSIDVSMTMRNTTAGALTALAGIKGGVER